MPNWKKVIVSGSDAALNSLDVTGNSSFLNNSVTIEGNIETILEVNGIISGSNGLYIENVPYDSTPVTDGVVVYDTADGKFYYTGSYGGGGGGGGGYVNVQIGTNSSVDATVNAEDGNNAYLRFISGSNISMSAAEGTDDNNVSTPDKITIQAIPSPSDTYVQYNSASVFHGDIGLRYDAEQESFRSGDSDPSLSGNDYGLYSGSHLLVDNRELVTNARYPNQNMHYHILGMNGRSFPIPKPGGGSYSPQGTYTSMGTGYANFSALPHSLNLDHITNPSIGLENDVLNGNVMVGGPYIHFDPTKGFIIYANSFHSVPGSPATSVGSDGFIIYPAASSEYDNSGSLLTPPASASVRIFIKEDAVPDSSDAHIVGRKTTLFQTGESGSEESYLIYENTTNTVGIGKGLTIENIKSDINTSKLVAVSGGLLVTGSSEVDDLTLKTEGGLTYTPTQRTQGEGGSMTRMFGLGVLGNKDANPTFHDSKVEFNRATYYEFGDRRGDSTSTARAFVVGADEVEFGSVRGSSDPVESPKSGIRFTSNPSIEFYNSDASSSISGAFEPTSASAQIKFDTGSSAIAFYAGDTTTDLIEVIHVSRSGDNPRVGVGTNDPKAIFDFKDVEDSTTGAEILLRSARTTEGALTGDEGGSINFTIDSGSYGDKLKTSGSLAKIKAVVKSATKDGAQGKLVFEMSKDTTTDPLNVLTLGYQEGGLSGFGTVFTSSLLLKGFNPALPPEFILKDSDDNVQFLVDDGNVTISGSLGVTGSATFDGGATSTTLTLTNTSVQNSEATSLMINGSGVVGTRELGTAAFREADQDLRTTDDVTFNTVTTTGNLTVEGDIIAENYIVSSSITYMTQSFSSGSTIFGDTIDDTHLFTGSVDITGSLTVDGMTYPTTDGNDGQVLLTDGSGALTFGDVKVYAQVKNISGVTLAKGTPVHATASASPPAGNVSEVIAASASLASSMPATFVLDEELANEAEGRAILSGFINGVDTSAFKEGDVVYVGPDGGYTTTKPTGTNLIQNLGIITKVDASNGAGYIYGSGRSNDVPNIAEGYAWVGNSSGVATATATSSFIPTGTVSSSAQTVANLDGQDVVVGSLNIKSSITDSFKIQNSAGTTTYVNFSPQGGLEIDLGGVGNSISASQDIKTHGDFIGESTHIKLADPDEGGGSYLYLSSSGDIAGGSHKLSLGDIEGGGNSTKIVIDDNAEEVQITGEITSNTIDTISTTIASDSATNVDTFATSTYNGAIYDYILKDSTVGARAGQFMVAHDNGLITFTDTSTKHLTDTTIPEITADISGGDVRIRVTNGNGYTFKSFVKKL